MPERSHSDQDKSSEDVDWKEIIQNTRKPWHAEDPITHALIRSGARCVEKMTDPTANADELVELLLNGGRGNEKGKGKGRAWLSVPEILKEAKQAYPEAATKGRFDSRWAKVQHYYADLLNYVLRDQLWNHHTREAAKALTNLATEVASGERTMTATEIAEEVAQVDRLNFQHSPGYALHLCLASAARPGSRVAIAAEKMYDHVTRRWNAACRLALARFEVRLSPDAEHGLLAYFLVALADGLALRSTSSGHASGQLDKRGTELLALGAMMLMVGAVDVTKSCEPMADRFDRLISDWNAGQQNGSPQQ